MNDDYIIQGGGARPLDGVRVIEMAGLAPSPYCGMLLSDFGADVVVVDRLSKAGPELSNMMPNNPFDRGKRSIRVNLKANLGIEILQRMIQDFDVLVGEEYYYYVAVVDSSMNHDGLSDTVIGRTNPPVASGWPQAVLGTFRSSAPAFGDIDHDYPGLEIVLGDEKGNLWAWHYDGTPVVGDGRIFYTPPLSWPEGLWSTVAIANVNDDEDGLLEIVRADHAVDHGDVVVQGDMRE